MRTLRKNQQQLQYALQIAEVPEFETDEHGNIIYEGYTDDNGNFFPFLDENGDKTVKPTGKFEAIYSEPTPFLASISMSGGEAEAVEYGLSTESYSAVMITEKNAVPLKEGSLIWHTSKPEYKYGGEEVEIPVNDETIKQKVVKKTSADFIVMKKSPSLNFDKYILTAVNK